MERVAGPADALKAAEQGLLACVHCGFCLDACPTYTRLGHEGDSPRGRLDLMRAVVEGRLEADDPAFRTHIDQCLGCRACEPVCPSGVPYGFLLERARTAIAQASGVSFSSRVLIAAYTGPFSGVVTALSRLLRATRLPRLLAGILPSRLAMPRFGMAMLASSAPWRGLRRVPGVADGAAAAAAAPSATQATRRRGASDHAGGLADDVAADPQRRHAEPHALAGAFPSATGATEAPNAARPGADADADAAGDADADAAGDADADGGSEARTGRPRAALLRGCVQQSLFARVNDATARVLQANGFEVVEARAQQCCGALDAHAGTLDRALELARANIAAFEASGAEVYVVNAAGCGAMMKEYAEQLRHDAVWSERAKAFSSRVRDVSELLVGAGVRRGAPLLLRVTYDAPCHLLHGQRIRDAPLALLDAIPGLERVPLEDADECCGGAGLYGVHHPDLGGRILKDKVDAIRATGAEVVVTGNPGCMMQIGAGLLLHDSAVQVLHPIELLDESYRRTREAE